MPDFNRWAASDIIDADKKAAIPRPIEVVIGLVLTHRSTSVVGQVVAFTKGARIILEDASGEKHEFAPVDGFFEHDGIRVSLQAPKPTTNRSVEYTASGSITADSSRAKVARASRIWVEGIHDAELLEKIWGDDLRAEAIVVEPLHGADELAAAVREFGPRPNRRLGVLLDHLVDGSKESRIASQVRDVDVLITGHPYVDIWEAIKPSAIGIKSWPTVPRGRPWKEGVVAALGFQDNTRRFWADVLGSVTSYTDIETPLVNAVERLIDFVTDGGG